MAEMGDTWWQDSYGLSPPPSNVSTQLTHIPLRNSTFYHLGVPLVAGMGTTWWQGIYGLSPLHTKVSTQLTHIQLRNSTFYPLAAPPGGRYGRHLGAR